MNTMAFFRRRLARTVLLAGGIISALLLASMLSKATTAATLLDDQSLEAKALAEAYTAGLQGKPEAQKAVSMTMADWLKLMNAELGKDAFQFGLTPDMPVYVLAIRGQVVWHGPGLPQPGQTKTEAETYDNITIVLNARTGETIWAGATRTGYSMPVPVP